MSDNVEVIEPAKGPHRPKGIKQPQDHKPPKKTAAQIEAEGIPTNTVEVGGESYDFPSDPQDWPVESTLAFEQNQAASALQALFGPQQWARFMRSKPTNRQLNDLSERVAEAAGFGSLGN